VRGEFAEPEPERAAGADGSWIVIICACFRQSIHRAPLYGSVLLTSPFFARREDSFATSEHHVLSDSAASPLPSVFSAVGGLRVESPRWLRP
jgi:hypothetical protein